MLNQLLTYLPGTLHEALTFEDIDLSEKRFNTRSHKRATLLEFMGDILDKNDNVFTYMFGRTGSYARLTIVYKDGNMFTSIFRLWNFTNFDNLDCPSGCYQKYTFRDYIAKTLSQNSSPYQVDYPHAKGFVNL